MIVLFGIDFVALVTTFGLCNLSFCAGGCFALDLAVVELLVVEDGPNNDSNESVLVCLVG
jgi:hypothetical protein